MYHRVSSSRGKADFLTIPVNNLEAQLQYLKQEGYNSILLSELVNYIREEHPCRRNRS
jgi:hypothetical protein